MRCSAIGGASPSFSGCPGWVTVVRDVGFELLAHLDYHSRKRAVQCE